MEVATADHEMRVQLFHASLLWPLQLEPLAAEEVKGRYREALKDKSWRQIDDELTADPALFQEWHCREFVSFLPYMQSFLYFFYELNLVIFSLLLFAIARFKRLSGFRETPADERVSFGKKMIALGQVVWSGGRA